MHLLDKFLMTPEGTAFSKQLAKVVHQYILALAAGTEAQLARNLERAEESQEEAKDMQKRLDLARSEALKKPVLQNPVARREEEARLKKQAEDYRIVKLKLEKAAQDIALTKKQQTDFYSNWVARSHLAMITTIFISHDCDENYFLAPQKIDRVFN